ncbi:MAG: 2-oxoacid:acceptor oxidoreductase family protein [Gammaproteobacteria bacterium]
MAARHDIVMGGFGGQGVKTIATLLGQAANRAGLHALMYNVYGAAIRGGAIYCYTAISDQPLVGAPVTTFPSAVLAMDQRSYATFEPVVQPGGTLIVNTSLVTGRSGRNDIRVVYVPSSEIADELGSFQLCGMVALGALVFATGIVSGEVILGCLETTLPATKHHLLEGNRRALARGAALCSAA